MNAWIIGDFGGPEVIKKREQPARELDDHTFTFGEIGAAHSYAEAGKQVENVVVTHPEV